MIRQETKYAPRVTLRADTGASRVPNMKSYWEAYFSVIYVSGFLGLYGFLETRSPVSNPVSWRLASDSRKSVTLVCEDTPKKAAGLQIPDSIDPCDAQTGVVERKNHSRGEARAASNSRSRGTRKGRALVVFVQEKRAGEFSTQRALAIGSQRLSWCRVLSL